ncbi:unnamed protein product [Adineta steineri]|uniref:Uncharacterized protein n=1 Tax=Adineta steineri TaxID=433720 RepID=A0A818ZNZ3_9BILA|nr:unnamed protein product [Adineta steineri]CAF3849584.1 unnamed protein product [Adineta steineri]CAF3864386.1 unnamed protein product [Adineta steineri]
MVINETFSISSSGWLIIDEIHWGASLCGLKVDGCMKKVQGNISYSQRPRALQLTTNNQKTKKYDALTSLQTRGIHLTLSGVTNIGTVSMDVSLRPQEVHDLVNCTGPLITSNVQEFFPDDMQQTSSIPTTTNTDNELIN